jgi:hypothetical protein
MSEVVVGWLVGWLDMCGAFHAVAFPGGSVGDDRLHIGRLHLACANPSKRSYERKGLEYIKHHDLGVGQGLILRDFTEWHL